MNDVWKCVANQFKKCHRSISLHSNNLARDERHYHNMRFLNGNDIFDMISLISVEGLT